jgi:lysophospholipase L1-like esterase
MTHGFRCAIASTALLALSFLVPVSLAPRQARAATLLMVGDSITKGYIGHADPDPYSGASYAELLATEFGPENVVNVACPGSTAANWHPFASPTPACGQFPGSGSLNLFAERIRPNTPVDVATVLLGTNDAVLGVSVENYRANLGVLVGGLLFSGAIRVLLITPPPMPLPSEEADETGVLARAVQLLSGYRAQALGICASVSGAECIDAYSLLAADLGFYFDPGLLHPNDAAHAMLAEQVSLRIVPEPSAAILIASGLVALSGRRPKI